MATTTTMDVRGYVDAIGLGELGTHWFVSHDRVRWEYFGCETPPYAGYVLAPGLPPELKNRTIDRIRRAARRSQRAKLTKQIDLDRFADDGGSFHTAHVWGREPISKIWDAAAHAFNNQGRR